MAAAKFIVKIDQGTTYERTLTAKDSSGNPVDITGWSFSSVIRDKIGGNLLGAFVFSILDQTSLTGQFTMKMTADITTLLIKTGTVIGKYGKYSFVYDMKVVTNSGYVFRATQGPALVSPQVTI